MHMGMENRLPSTPPPEPYNPFKDPAKSPPQAPPMSEGAKRIARDIEEELAKPEEEIIEGEPVDEEKTTLLFGRPAREIAKEGEPLNEEETAPKMEIQTDREALQEGQTWAQETAEAERVSLDNVDPNDPAAVKEAARHVVDTLLDSERQLASLQTLGLDIKKIELERARLETIIRDKVRTAVVALQADKERAHKIMSELYKDVASMAAKL